MKIPSFSTSSSSSFSSSSFTGYWKATPQGELLKCTVPLSLFPPFSLFTFTFLKLSPPSPAPFRLTTYFNSTKGYEEFEKALLQEKSVQATKQESVSGPFASFQEPQELLTVTQFLKESLGLDPLLKKEIEALLKEVQESS